jgi:hypothetical protein
MKLTSFVLPSLLLGACGPVEPPDPDAAPVTRSDVLTVRALPNRDLDLLFIVDDSPSMLDKQAAVRAAFPAFVEQLASFEGGMPNLHLGVVSTDMGTKGSAVALPGPAVGQVGAGGCAASGKAGNLLTNGAPITGAFLSDIQRADGTRQRNYTGDLEAVFGQMASLGGGGCGFEQPLHAMRAALSGNAANAGFLRPSASLAVIVLTDEDDCSLLDPRMLGPDSPALGPLQSFRCFQFGVECAPDDPMTPGAKTSCHARAASPFVEDVAPFKTFLTGLKVDPRELMFGVLGGKAPVAVELRALPGGGTPQPALAHSCSFDGATGPTVADPPVRLDQLAASFDAGGRSEPICGADVTTALVAMGQTTRQLAGDPCLIKSIADAAPEVPGLQPDCVVVDIAGAQETELPRCGRGGNACWDLVEDATRCTAQPQHLKLVVTRTVAPLPDTYTSVRCTTPG